MLDKPEYRKDSTMWLAHVLSDEVRRLRELFKPAVESKPMNTTKTKPFNFDECLRRFNSSEDKSNIVRQLDGTPCRIVAIHPSDAWPIIARWGDSGIACYSRQGSIYGAGEGYSTDLVLIARTVKREAWIPTSELEGAYRDSAATSRGQLVAVDFCHRVASSVRVEWEAEV